MTTYAIGDIQGCHAELLRLLDKLAFDPASDRLWFAGDIVNRGPGSLAALRTVIELGDRAVCVLGNHDIHLLSVMCGYRKAAPKDTLDDILEAADRETLFDWLRHRPLLHHDETLGYTMVHAGIHPFWTLETAREISTEIESALQGPSHKEFIQSVFSNKPEKWNPEDQGIDRLRFGTNCLTRMRYCNPKGELEFGFKGPIDKSPHGLLPWYQVPGRLNTDLNILFGHWASHGTSTVARILPLDFGCVWGGKLVALALETGEYTEVAAS